MSKNLIHIDFMLQHDHIHNIRDIHHMIINGQHVIVNFQDLAQEGSLKDLIHKVKMSVCMFENE